MEKIKRIRIDQSNKNNRMEVNGKEVRCGSVLQYDVDGVKLNLCVEGGDKGYYIMIERI